jgi:hypothetical protein
VVTLVLDSDHLVTGPLGETSQVLLGGGIVGEYLEHFSWLERVDGGPSLKERFGTEQPDRVEGICVGFIARHRDLQVLERSARIRFAPEKECSHRELDRGAAVYT